MPQKLVFCAHCSYTTTRNYNLKRHCISVHGVEDAPNVQTGAPNVQSGAPNVACTHEHTQTDELSHQNGFKCPSCYMVFSQKRYVQRHLPRCKKISSPLECEKCHKIYQTRSALSMHRNRCDGTHVSEVQLMGSVSTPSVTNVTQNVHITVNQINVAGDINNNTINNNVIVNNFDKENKEYIAMDFVRQCLNQGCHGISPMIDKIYFDPEHPENHNVLLESFKNRLVKVMQENKWQLASLVNTVDSMITKASNFILTALTQEIMQNITEDTIQHVHSIQNLEPNMKKRIREHTKGRLARRRAFAT